jgi:hypothetical protein
MGGTVCGTSVLVTHAAIRCSFLAFRRRRGVAIDLDSPKVY